MREACEQQGREQEAASQRAGKEAEESAKRDLAALREHFRSVDAEKTEGKLRRAPKRTCNDIEEAQPKPPLTVSVCVGTCKPNPKLRRIW